MQNPALPVAVGVYLSPHFGNKTSLSNKIVKALQFDPKQRGCFRRPTLAQIASKLDEHMSVLVEGLNTSLVSCAKLSSRRWCSWDDMGQWKQEELVINGLIHNLLSRLYIDPIQSGETLNSVLNVNWFAGDTCGFWGLSNLEKHQYHPTFSSIILAKCQLISNCHVLVWLCNSKGCLLSVFRSFRYLEKPILSINTTKVCRPSHRSHRKACCPH